MASANSDEDDRTMWVGGLDSRVTEELLWELFLQAGPLESVKIPKDMKTGKNKNFAFVKFLHQNSVPYTIDLMNGLRLYDNNLCLRRKIKPNGNGPESFERDQTAEQQRLYNEQDNYNFASPNGWQMPPNMMMMMPQHMHSPWGNFPIDGQGHNFHSRESRQDFGWDESRSPHCGRRDLVMRRGLSSPGRMYEEDRSSNRRREPYHHDRRHR